MSNWRAFANRVDRAVDRVFGERVELHPWTNPSAGDAGSPDPSRAVKSAICVFERSESSTQAEAGGMSTQVETLGTWITISESNLGDPSLWNVWDRVYMPERKEWFTIERIGLSATGRTSIHLTRLNE